MQPDLIGYALNALDPDAHADVETYLRAHPEAESQVDAIRQALEPLSWNHDAGPPQGLAARTLAYVAARAPEQTPAPLGIRGIPWRRVVQAAAAVVVAATAIAAAISWMGGLQGQRPGNPPNLTQVVVCKNNLREIFTLLSTYSDSHQQQFPSVSAALDPPKGVGGLVFSVLHDNKLLPADIQLACPGVSGPVPAVVSLTDIKAMNDGAYRQWAQSLQQCYAYSLGYDQGGKLVGPRLEDGKPSALMPLMADCAPLDPLGTDQSANHGGAGQNVLYCDGHVAFCHSRNVGYNLDDIFLSRDRKVAAGVDWSDAVLASGMVPP